MTVNSASVSVLALAWCLAGMAVLSSVRIAHAQPEPVLLQMPSARIELDIPAQRLGDAIDAYSLATRMDVLIDGRYVERLSGAVRGSLTASEAIGQMLAGTDLKARFSNATSVVIQASWPSGIAARSAMPEAEGTEESGFNEGEVLHQSYAAQIQQALRVNLCGSAQTRPGGYRLALQLRLDARGAVERFRLLSTTGEPARDAAVQRRMWTLSVGSPPPPSLPQPLVVLLLPEGPGAQADCGPAEYRGSEARTP